MKKKWLITLLCIASTLTLAFGLSACDESGGGSNGAQSTQQPSGSTQNPEGDSGTQNPEQEQPHVHTLTAHKANPKTCDSNGNTAYWWCSGCYKYFSDAEGTTEITRSDTVIPATGHTLSEHEANPKTCTTAGNIAYWQCSDCQNYFSDAEGTMRISEEQTIIPASHDYVEGECSVCHEKKPSEGLKYTLSDDETYYTVTGKGTCTDTDIVIPAEYNGMPVKVIGNSAFKNCNSLTSITIPNSVTSIGSSAFESCSGLTSIYYKGDIAGWCDIIGLYNLTGYGNSNKTLTIGGNLVEGDLVIPDNVTSIGSGAFYGCNVTSITIPDSVTWIGSFAFDGCNGLTSIDYTGDIAGWCGIIGLENLMSYGSDNKTLTIGGNLVEGDLVIPDSVTSIGNYAFYNCSSLTSVTIGNGVTSIGKHAFHGCSSFTSIIIPNNVTGIGECAFSGCSSLTNIAVASGNKKYHATGNCLIEIESKTLILGCKNSVIPTAGNVTGIGIGAFYNCSGLTNITIPDCVT